jgi:hypothetical protein
VGDPLGDLVVGRRLDDELVVDEVNQLVPRPPDQPEAQDGAVGCRTLKKVVSR